MLYIYKSDTLEGVQIYGDDQVYYRYYLLPEQPRYRVDENGHPIFKFLKYRFPIDRADGRKGGGFVVFDVEFTVPDDKFERIKATLQERVRADAQRFGQTEAPAVEIGAINFTKGTAHLNIMNADGVLVQRISQAGKPSLYGKNISTYSVELTPEGATLFEQALQGQGGFVSVVYDLYFSAKLPPLKVTAYFHADAFYQFVQEIDVEERFWGEDDYRESLTEIMRESESQDIIVDAPPDMDTKIVAEVRAWAQKSLEDAIERHILEAFPAESAEEAKKLYTEQDFENVHRNILRYRSADVMIRYRESATVEFNKAPQGTLPNITSLVDKQGNPIVWSDYAQEVDLDDPFFRQLNVAVHVNADFAELPIHSVEVKLKYNDHPMAILGEGQDGEYRFSSPDAMAHFASFVENNNWKYRYSYQVNYKGAARIFQSPEIETDESVLTVNVDDMGILLVDIAPGDLNFAQVNQVQLALRYEDQTNGITLIEQQFIIDQAHPTHRFQDVIFAQRTRPYQYRVKYYMKNGKEYQLDWVNGETRRLYINDPFNNTKRIGIRAAGDLEKEIDTIFVDFTYVDEGNNYTQSTSIALNSRQPFFDWEFPVIDEKAGVVSYQGTITYKDGTSLEIPTTVTTSSTPLVGETVADRLAITVVAELVDFNKVKLARVGLRYDDGPNGVLERKEFIFGGNRPKEQTWNLKLKDKTKVSYAWDAAYFMTDGARKSLPSTITDELTLFLETPA